MRRSRRKKSRLPVLIAMILLAGVLGTGFWLGYKIFNLVVGDPLALSGESGDVGKIEGLTVLLLGMDAREGEKNARTDTIIVMNVGEDGKRMSLLSIPRDTRVEIPGHGVDKINAANVYGGPELAMETVSDLIGVPVEYYVLTNLNGFKEIVDTLGGVTLEVEKNMYHREISTGGKYDINLKAGVQRLDGDKALQYVRYRSDGLGDINRTQRQLKFLTALAEEVMQTGTIAKLPKLIPQIYRHVDTNLKLAQLISLARTARDLDDVKIVTQTLPGRFYDTRGGSYWLVDEDQAREVALALFKEGRVFDVVQGSTVSDSPRREKVNLSQRVASVNTVTTPSPEAVKSGGVGDVKDVKVEEDAKNRNNGTQVSIEKKVGETGAGAEVPESVESNGKDDETAEMALPPAPPPGGNSTTGTGGNTT